MYLNVTSGCYWHYLLFARFSLLVATLVLSPTWEASAILEVRKVGQVLVEPVANVIVRMMRPSFTKGVLNSAAAAATKSEELKTMEGFIALKSN